MKERRVLVKVRGQRLASLNAFLSSLNSREITFFYIGIEEWERKRKEV